VQRTGAQNAAVFLEFLYASTRAQLIATNLAIPTSSLRAQRRCPVPASNPIGPGSSIYSSVESCAHRSRATLVLMNSIRVALVLCLCSISVASAKESDARDFFEGPVRIAPAGAAARGQTDALDKLLSEGADVNLQGRQGMTATHWALVHLSKPGVGWLLHHHSNPNVTFERDGTSAVSMAAKLVDPWFLNEILTFGGDANLRNPMNGRTPIFEAIAADRRDNAGRLIASSADMNVLDRLGETPVVMAAAVQKFDLVSAPECSWKQHVVEIPKHGLVCKEDTPPLRRAHTASA
jgi:uncharacterized protein